MKADFEIVVPNGNKLNFNLGDRIVLREQEKSVLYSLIKTVEEIGVPRTISYGFKEVNDPS